MAQYKIFVDAAADIPQQECKRYHIEVLPIPVAFGEQTYQSGVELTNEEFYKLLESSDSMPVTSQITPYAFEELFKAEYEAKTENLILILINSKGSATYGNAVAMRDRFYQKHPEAQQQMRIHLFDGASYSGGYGYAAILAAQKLEMGQSIDDVLAFIEKQLSRQRIYFGLYSLKYAGKSGRIPGAAVFVGEALGIKPIMQVWDHGITTVGKARGEKKLVRELVKMITDDMRPNTPYSLVYGNDESVRDELCEELTKKIGYPPVYSFQIGAAVAINAGPRVVGAIFEVSRKRVDKEEKKDEKKKDRED